MKIIKNKPMPTRGKSPITKEFLATMEVGDATENFTLSQRSMVASIASIYGKNTNKKFSVHKTSDKTAALWRRQ